MTNPEPIFKLVKTVMVLMILSIIAGSIYNYKLANDCINTNDPNSRECFRYNVLNAQTRTVNVY